MNPTDKYRDYATLEVDPDVLDEGPDSGDATKLGHPQYTCRQHLLMAAHDIHPASIALHVAKPLSERADADDIGFARQFCVSGTSADARILVAVINSALSATYRDYEEFEIAADLTDIGTLQAARSITRTRIGDTLYTVTERLARNITADHGNDSPYAQCGDWYEYAMLAAVGGERLSRTTRHHLLTPWMNATNTHIEPAA